MRILIANDDGIYSPGLAALSTAAKHFGDVRIVAPDVEMSSMGHAITHARPLAMRRTKLPELPKDSWRVNGTPADCVTLGIGMGDVDLVLSGVNLGPNLGNSMWHSGTLAGAKQAALLGKRGIALSTPMDRDEPRFDLLMPWIERVLALLVPMNELCLLNVNFPTTPKDIRWTRQSVRHYDGKVVPVKDPAGRQLQWITAVPVEETEEGTDRWAVAHGFVSITPLRLDLTDEKALAAAATKR